MPSLQPKFLVDPKTGRYLGQFSDFLTPEEIAKDREGQPLLDDNGDPVFVIKSGRIIKARDVPNDDAVEVPAPPNDGRDTWDGTKWIPHAPDPVPLDPAAFMRAALDKGLITEAEILLEMDKAKG